MSPARKAEPARASSGHMQLRQKCDGYSPDSKAIADEGQQRPAPGSGVPAASDREESVCPATTKKIRITAEPEVDYQ